MHFCGYFKKGGSMCLVMKGDLKIAEKDIVCYKKVLKLVSNSDKMWRAYYISCISYPYNRILTAEKIIDNQRSGEQVTRLEVVEGQYIYEGFHAFTKNIKKETDCILDQYGMKKICIIPKGAQYCEGGFDEIVATHMIVFRDEKQYKRYCVFRPFIRLYNKITSKTPNVYGTRR